MLNLLMHAVVIGAGATGLMDLWAAVLRRAFGVPSLDFALLGRWVGHFAQGRFRHANIAKAAPITRERILGWTMHYGIGITFAWVLLAATGPGWLARPTLLAALAVSTLTLVAPYFVMQPAMGFGVAASKTPRPSAARLRSLVTHTVYGVGLYASACVWAALSR